MNFLEKAQGIIKLGKRRFPWPKANPNDLCFVIWIVNLPTKSSPSYPNLNSELQGRLRYFPEVHPAQLSIQGELCRNWELLLAEWMKIRVQISDFRVQIGIAGRTLRWINIRHQELNLRLSEARISKRSGSLSRAVVGYLPEAVSVPMKKAGNFKLDKVPLKILKLSNKCFQTSIFHQQQLGTVVRTPDLQPEVKTVRGSNPVRGNIASKEIFR